jgi:hypothetical protein
LPCQGELFELPFDDFDKEIRDGFLYRSRSARIVGVLVGEVPGGEDGGGDGLRAGVLHDWLRRRRGRVAEEGESIIAQGIVGLPAAVSFVLSAAFLLASAVGATK